MHDDHRLPSELEPVADTLRAARHEPSGLELDALHQRVFTAGPRAPRGGGRRSLVGSLLATAALLASGATAMVAAGQVTGSSSYTPVEGAGQAGACQYAESYTGTSSKGNSNATLTMAYGCAEQRTVCVTSTKAISNYQFVPGSEKVEIRGTETYEICEVVPDDATGVALKSGTTAYSFTLPGT